MKQTVTHDTSNMNNAVQRIRQIDKQIWRQADLFSCSSALALRTTLFITIVFIIIAVFILVKRRGKEGGRGWVDRLECVFYSLITGER